VKLSDEKIELDNFDPHLGQIVPIELSREACIISENFVINVNLFRFHENDSD
jgi:hypothetical protein